LTRAAWRGVAERAGVRAIDVEFICSDVDEQRRRVERRRAEEPEAGWPAWREVLERDYRPWDRDRLVIDTTTLSVEEAVREVLKSC